MPRVIPRAQRDALAMLGTIPVGSSSPLDAQIDNSYVQQQALERQGKCTATAPYVPGCGHSYFRDLLLVAEAEARKDKAASHPVLRGRDQGALDYSDTDLDEARLRSSTSRQSTAPRAAAAPAACSPGRGS